MGRHIQVMARLTVPEDSRVFDRELVRARRNRAAAGFDAADFLLRYAGEQIAERLLDIKRSFPLALDLGCHTGVLHDILQGRGDVETLIHADLAPAMAGRAARPGAPAFAADEEWLPVAEESLDLVLSNLSLHWVNDLPGALVQINRALKPDGLFHGAMLGGDTLVELRRSLSEAEIELDGGLSPRVSPMTQAPDAGNLLQRAGLALPVIDTEQVTVTYDTPFKLMADLRAMGATNAVLERRRQPLKRSTLMRAVQIYQETYADTDGRVPATFEVIYMHGWAPHESQQKPLRPGSAKHRLADALGTVEHKTGVKAAPGSEFFQKE